MYYRMHIAYDGTKYHGWQQQGDITTVADEISQAFARTFHLPFTLVGASRTDVGVHAYDQVARATTDLVLEPEWLCEVLNRALPQDIVIRGISNTTNKFHPQANVCSKIYWYHVFVKRPLPFIAQYGYHMSAHLDLKKLESCLQQVIGTHDFRSFCTGAELTDTTRYIERITIDPLPRFGAYRIAVQGPRFLYRMIRRTVGAALYVASNPKLSPQTYEDIFLKCDPLHTLPTAPAQGLLLRKIIYQEQP